MTEAIGDVAGYEVIGRPGVAIDGGVRAGDVTLYREPGGALAVARIAGRRLALVDEGDGDAGDVVPGAYAAALGLLGALGRSVPLTLRVLDVRGLVPSDVLVLRRRGADGAESAAEAPPGVSAPSDPSAYRTFRLTWYYVAEQDDDPGSGVPILAVDGTRIADASAAFFAKLSLEGTGKLSDGRLVNVTGKTVAVDGDQYAPVLEYHRRRLPNRPSTYSGIILDGDGRVVRALAFHVVAQRRLGLGYGILHGIPLEPFWTLAADIGRTRKSDPDYRNRGGVVPLGTHVYVKALDGASLPGGATHDGWCTVNDTGGGIFGAHFDVFAGTRRLKRSVSIAERSEIWFPGIEERIPQGYEYGLRP